MIAKSKRVLRRLIMLPKYFSLFTYFHFLEEKRGRGTSKPSRTRILKRGTRWAEMRMSSCRIPDISFINSFCMSPYRVSRDTYPIRKVPKNFSYLGNVLPDILPNEFPKDWLLYLENLLSRLRRKHCRIKR